MQRVLVGRELNVYREGVGSCEKRKKSFGGKWVGIGMGGDCLLQSLDIFLLFLLSNLKCYCFRVFQRLSLFCFKLSSHLLNT